MTFSLLHFLLIFWSLWQSFIQLIIPPAYAAVPSQFQDDFSHGLSQWQAVRGSFDLWTVSGEKARATVSTQSTLTEIVPRDEFWNPNWHNLNFAFEYTPVTGADRNISFGYQNTLNWYDLHFVEDFYQLARVQNGFVTFSIFHPYLLPNGKTYQMRLVLRDGRIQLFIDGQLVVDEVDWSFNQNFGKISLKATAGTITPTTVQFDNIVVTPLASPDETHLGAPLIKQNDIKWKDLEYDHAHLWSPNQPTFNRWACALTSMVMILQYYGMHNLPNGQEITPVTLNSWLNQEPDGYFQSGNVNWNAITRLTKQIHDLAGTVKLEYSYLPGDLEQVKSEIIANRPTILEIPGHFLVADGLSADKQTVYIKDPAYDYTQFNQHNTPLLSARKFLPSFTDLSAIVITAPTDVDVFLRDEQGHALPGIEQTDHWLQDPTQPSGEKSPAIRYLLFSKPAEGKYRLHIGKSTHKMVLEIFAYDQQANFSDLSQFFASSPAPRDLLITFHRGAPSTITTFPMSFHQLRVDLQALRDTKDIHFSYDFRQLDRLVVLMEQTSNGRYVSALQQKLSEVMTHMTVEASHWLADDLDRLSTGK